MVTGTEAESSSSEASISGAGGSAGGGTSSNFGLDFEKDPARLVRLDCTDMRLLVTRTSFPLPYNWP